MKNQGFKKAMQIVNSLPLEQQTLLIQCSMSTNSTPRKPIMDNMPREYPKGEQMQNIKTITDFINTRPSMEDFINEVEKHLLDLMNENPDFVYSSGESTSGESNCFYHKGPEDNPCDGCLFGQAFQRMGMLKENMADWGALDNFSHSKIRLKAEDPRIPTSWNDIQRKQDNGAKWGELKELLHREQ